MANQPSKYSKFLVGAASAALVASAVAPVASAADFKDTKGNTHEEAINALSDAGVISGYPDGTFLPNKTLSRSDVVKLMGKWLVAEGSVVPTDYKTNPRFTDLKTTSNDELLKYAAVVKDNGVFVGTPDGKLDPTGNITRENMAVVLVRAFDRVHEIDLTTYVAGQDFKKDVTDLGKAKAEARPAIDVLDFFNITNPAAPAFNPKSTTSRGQFATFLYKTTKTDFSDVTTGVVGSAVVKAVNATTVEVAFKEKVENLNSLNFKIDGLTVSNAVIKQTGDDKVVVLTTAVQKGGEKYTVTLNEKAIGSFEGISGVIPTSIKLTSNSAQAKVGNQVILSAFVGVKEKNVPVTFNVAPGGALNKSQIVEVFTDAEGIATFSYTQYNQGRDHVAVYPTGAPALRDLATVYWGVDNILTLEEDKAGAVVANGTKKTYTVTYLDEMTGRPVPNAELNVTFKENVDVDFSAAAKATVTDSRTGVTITPYQAKSGAKETLTIKTDSTGKATFTVSGTNVAVTPIVFVDAKSTVTQQGNGVFDAQELAVVANKVQFSGAQVNYALTIDAVGDAEAATGAANGRVYKVKVLNPTDNNKVYAGGLINVALDENLDRNMSTNSNAKIKNVTDGTSVVSYSNNDQQAVIKLDSKGEGTFILYGEKNDQGTPVIWIDQNNSLNKQQGILEEGEPSSKGAITYFQDSRISGAKLSAINTATNKDAKDFPNNATGHFTFDLTNQSGKAFGNYYGKATFEIRNTGSSALTLKESDDNLFDQNGNRIANPTIIEVGGSITVTTNVLNGKANFNLSSATATSATIISSAVTADKVQNGWSTDDRNYNKYVAAETFTATFSGEFVPANFTGEVLSVDKVADTVTLKYGTSTYTISYKDAEYYYHTSSVQSTPEFFESELSVGDLVTFTKAANADSKNKFDIIKDGAPVSSLQKISSAIHNSTDGTLTITFGEAVKAASIVAGDFAITGGGTVASVVPMTGNSQTVVLNVTGTVTGNVTVAPDKIEFVSGVQNSALSHAITAVTTSKLSALATTDVNTKAVTGTDATASTTVDGVAVDLKVLAANGPAKYNTMKVEFVAGSALVATFANNVITVTLDATAATNSQTAIQSAIDGISNFGNFDFSNVVVTTAGNFNGATTPGSALLANGIDNATAKVGKYTFTIEGNLVTGDKVTVNGKEYVAGINFAVGSTALATATNLAAKITTEDSRFATVVASGTGLITLTDANADGKAAPTLKLN